MAQTTRGERPSEIEANPIRRWGPLAPVQEFHEEIQQRSIGMRGKCGNKRKTGGESKTGVSRKQSSHQLWSEVGGSKAGKRCFNKEEKGGALTRRRKLDRLRDPPQRFKKRAPKKHQGIPATQDDSKEEGEDVGSMYLVERGPMYHPQRIPGNWQDGNGLQKRLTI